LTNQKFPGARFKKEKINFPKQKLYFSFAITRALGVLHSPDTTLFAWLISHRPAVLFSQNKSATSNQPSVLFSQNKSAPGISHQPNEQAVAISAA
jgi:hypothetical protein